MARATYYLDVTAADPFLAVPLGWEAATIVVLNPTKYSIAVRVGSPSRPRGLSDAQIPVAPAADVCLPTQGREFALLATTPTLPLAPSGMPTIVTVMFLDAREPAPAFGSIALTGQPPASAVVLASGSGNNTNFTATVALPTGVNRVEVHYAGPVGQQGCSVAGVQSGIQYLLTGTADTDADHVPTAPVSPALDSTITCALAALVPGAYTVVFLGYADSQLPALSHLSGRKYVDVLAPGANALPVSVPLYPDVPAPSYRVFGTLVSPAAGATVATTPAMAAGDYYVEAFLSSVETPALGRFIVLRQALGVISAQYVPANLYATLTLRRVTVAAGATFDAVTGGAGAVGSIYNAEIRAYRLT